MCYVKKLIGYSGRGRASSRLQHQVHRRPAAQPREDAQARRRVEGKVRQKEELEEEKAREDKQ